MDTNFTLPVFSEHSKRYGRYSHIPNPDLFAILPMNDEDFEEPDAISLQAIMSFAASYNVKDSDYLAKIEEYNN